MLIAGMFTFIGPEFVRMCEYLGNDDEAKQAKMDIKRMKEAILKHGYEGEWFLRAYDDAGKRIGSADNEEGKIYIEPQGFCVMAGIGTEDGKAIKALDSVKKNLDTPYGMVLLNPGYTKYHHNLGEISTYPPGYKENAGIFCHVNPWIVAAETVLGTWGQSVRMLYEDHPGIP